MNTLLIGSGTSLAAHLERHHAGGGAIFWRYGRESRDWNRCRTTRGNEASAAIRSRWSKWVMASSGLLLVTGLVNFMLIVQRFDLDKTAFPGSKYHMFFGIKFLLALGVFMLSALLTGRSAAAEKMRRNERMWLNVNVLLAVAVVCLGGLLKSATRHPKSAQSLRPDPPSAAQSSQTQLRHLSRRSPPNKLKLWRTCEFVVDSRTDTMDKKAKKRLDVIHNKLQQLQLSLSGAKKQVRRAG